MMRLYKKEQINEVFCCMHAKNLVFLFSYVPLKLNLRSVVSKFNYDFPSIYMEKTYLCRFLID